MTRLTRSALRNWILVICLNANIVLKPVIQKLLETIQKRIYIRTSNTQTHKFIVYLKKQTKNQSIKFHHMFIFKLLSRLPLPLGGYLDKPKIVHNNTAFHNNAAIYNNQTNPRTIW